MHPWAIPPGAARASADERRRAAACLAVIAIHWLVGMFVLFIAAM